MKDTAFLSRATDVLANQKTETDFLRLVALYLHGTAEQREIIRSAWKPAHRWKIPMTSDFPLKQGLPAEQRLMGALVYKSIENLRMDSRDTLVNLSADEFVAGRAGLDFNALLEVVAKVSTPEFAVFLQGWRERKPEDRALAAFAWTDKSTSRHVRLIFG